MSLLAVLLAAVAAAPLQEQDADIATKLVQRIQQDLSEVDKQLEQAAGEDELGDQLKQARAAHVRAISDLEDLIRQIKYRRSQSSSSSGGGGGGSSSSQPDPRQADDRSQAQPAPSPQQEERTGQEQRPAGQQGEQPKGGEADPGPGEQRAGQQPPPDAVDDFLRRDTDARWGVLPPKLQERLMNLHVDDVPERYRTWLEAYVRELNRRDTGGTPP